MLRCFLELLDDARELRGEGQALPLCEALACSQRYNDLKVTPSRGSWRIITVHGHPPMNHEVPAGFRGPLKGTPLFHSSSSRGGRESSGGGLEAAGCDLSPEGGPDLASLRRTELKLILATAPATTPYLCPDIMPSPKGDPLSINRA